MSGGILGLMGNPYDEGGGLLGNVPELQNSHGGSVMSGLLGGMYSGLTLPRDVYQGKVDLNTDEGTGRVLDMAGTAMTGGLAGVPMQAGETVLAAGIPRQAFGPNGIDLGWVMKDVDRAALNSQGKAFNRLRSQMTDSQNYVEADLPIRSMIATQPNVNLDFAEAAAKSSKNPDGLDLPAVYKVDGKYYVADGHHRLTAASETSDVARVRLFDVDAARSGPADPSQQDMFR